jgi:hypothetical protein
MFLNNKLLNSGKKKYFALICFQMDGTQFFHSQLFWLLLTNFFLNGIALFFFVVGVFGGSIYEAIVLFILSLSLRVIGETLNISFFRKYHYIWYSNTKIYFVILLLLLGCSALPYFFIILPFSIIELISFLVFVISIFCLFSLIRMDDYLLLYKQIQKMTDVMSSQNEADYLKQSMINEKDKNRVISSKKLEKKKGYDYFNTIFFERHREILLRSARRYALFFALLYTVLAYLMIHYENYQNNNTLNTPSYNSIIPTINFNETAKNRTRNNSVQDIQNIFSNTSNNINLTKYSHSINNTYLTTLSTFNPSNVSNFNKNMNSILSTWSHISTNFT